MAQAYTVDSVWRNRDTLVTGRDEIIQFLTQKWERELDYALRKNLWCFEGNSIALRFQYESHDPSGRWWHSYGDLGIDVNERRSFGPRPTHELGQEFPLS